jgi:hypothetical protein
MITENRVNEIRENNAEMVIKIQEKLASQSKNFSEDEIVLIALANGLEDYLTTLNLPEYYFDDNY